MNYHYDGESFFIEDYNHQPAFSSFLPGIAGLKGVPLWSFYVNRGQGIAAFGAEDRDQAIMEYKPAVVAYEDTERKGFRTFIHANAYQYEPFSPHGLQQKQTMMIQSEGFSIKDVHLLSGLETTVRYRTLPQENIGALIRKVTIRNTGTIPQNIHMVDGMARVLPYGIRNSEFHEMANLLKSYFDVQRLDDGVVLFSSKSSMENTAEVGSVLGAHFYCASREGHILPIVSDPRLLYGNDMGYGWPHAFFSKEKVLVGQEQYTSDLIPCAMSEDQFILCEGECKVLHTLIGYAPDLHDLEGYSSRFSDAKWCEKKLSEADSLVTGIVEHVETHTAEPLFDAYVRQSMLDNVIRGGMPTVFGGKLLHTYGRRHGDLERDYNFFRLEAGHYSQGDGNFRDVCQNRRNDVLFFPEVRERDVIQFLGSIQLDGYNALELQPTELVIQPEREDAIKRLLMGEHVDSEEVLRVLRNGITPGEFWRLLRRLRVSDSDYMLERITDSCVTRESVVYRDGYWIDHWTYILDLIESYSKMYPEFLGEMLFSARVPYPKSNMKVLPFRKRVRQTELGLRQYKSVVAGDEGNGGGTLAVSPFVKLFFLSVLKCATLDPLQQGLEMEAGKPGWNDALNGLPGLFGSSSSECADLLLLIRRLTTWVSLDVCEIEVPTQMMAVARDLVRILKRENYCERASMIFWKDSVKIREVWRETVYSGNLSDEVEMVSRSELLYLLSGLESLVSNCISHAMNPKKLLDTYHVYEPVLRTEADTPTEDDVLHFEARPLPLFLEGQTKLLRVGLENPELIHETVKSSGLYDDVLNMYRTCESIEKESIEIGRIRAFTPGVFERESIFTHAEYKYLLALMDAGLYKQAFEEMRTVLIPFLNPIRYGRSVLENSSYIVSSAHPDPSQHGRGFIPRLSGATAETLTLWIRMFLGNQLFQMKDGMLSFAIEPKLPGWVFTKEGKVSFKYLQCQFTYHNQIKGNTFGNDAVRVRQIVVDGKQMDGSNLIGSYAEKLRRGGIRQIDVFLRR